MEPTRDKDDYSLPLSKRNVKSALFSFSLPLQTESCVLTPSFRLRIQSQRQRNKAAPEESNQGIGGIFYKAYFMKKGSKLDSVVCPSLEDSMLVGKLFFTFMVNSCLICRNKAT